ncbi:unnamed protein product [Toxocara canis]|uniref:Secreted protein n=1 Tax=Toxocara canis TaxID=6265 RepID=A0A183UJ24_TOXCA|nr:unnamed protein product [Toxocara canis]
MDKRTFVRTWLAFTVLQLIGNLWQCSNSKTFPTKMFREHAWTHGISIVVILVSKSAIFSDAAVAKAEKKRKLTSKHFLTHFDDASASIDATNLKKMQ